jgi:hypothetical protein
LRDTKLGVTDAIGGNLQQIFEQSDPPARDSRDLPPLIGEILEVCIPSEGHKDIEAATSRVVLTITDMDFLRLRATRVLRAA